MCNHKYTFNYSQQRASIGKECPYARIYSELKNNKAPNFENIASNLELPLDSHGICIFHSNELKWKRENDFTTKFLELLQLLNAYNDDSYCYDFAEFVFVGEHLKSRKDVKYRVFNLPDCTLNKEADFIGALFVDRVELNNISFKLGATFQEARFNGELKMKNISFGSADFRKTIFEQSVFFEDVDFLGYALFEDSQFTGSSSALIKFSNSKFCGLTDFSGAAVKSKHTDCTLLFENVKFEDSVYFTDCTFDCSVSFKNVEFDFAGEFIDTSFNTTKSMRRFRYCAVEFLEIEVNKNGSLIFQSTDSQNKMFNQEVEFSFKKDIEGTIRFENVNFNNISDSSRKNLIRLSKLGKVAIGPGCIKYRFQTETKTILIDENNQSLILEIGQTFTNYFAVQNGLNLGFEIVERDNNKISFFYFTDENITEAEFFDRLKKAEQDLWHLLSTEFDEQYLLTDGQVGTSLSKENAIINAVDGVSALVGTFFRVGIRIAFGRWSSKDTKALINVIEFNNQEPSLNAANLHQTLLDRYTGRALFLIRDRQNQSLALFQNRYRLIEENTNMGTTTKTKILFLAANPSNSRLKLDEEAKEIQTNLKLAKERDNLEFKQEWAVTVETLMQAILDESPNIVNFSGHGRQEGIILQNEIGEPKIVGTEALESLFKLFKASIKCVVLNSCYSETQAKVIKSHIPYVIGMKSEIPDRAAIAFSKGFYKAIGAGKDIPFAFELGITAIKLEGVTGDNIPVLL